MILAVDTGIATCGWSVVEVGNGKLADIGYETTKPDDKNGVQHGRIVRTQVIAKALIAAAARHDIGAIAGESLSFGFGNRASGIASVSLAWGVLCALAVMWGVPIVDVSPKQWQCAVVGREGKVVYSEVEQALHSYVEGQSARVLEQLLAIPTKQRNHALDAVGIGVYASMNGLASRPLISQPTQAKRSS